MKFHQRQIPLKIPAASHETSSPPIPEKLVELARELQRLIEKRNSTEFTDGTESPKE